MLRPRAAATAASFAAVARGAEPGDADDHDDTGVAAADDYTPPPPPPPPRVPRWERARVCGAAISHTAYRRVTPGDRRVFAVYLGSANRDGERYILLELCAGGSVRQLLDMRHPRGLPHDLLHSYGAQLLVGLHFLHGHMIIHRDLKGENVLFADPSCATLKIADFGSSSELLAGTTLSLDVTTIRGSPFWMSPEHICGQRCGRKADVWSAGCVLLEMLTGVPPWREAGVPQESNGRFAVFALLNRIVSSEGPPPCPPAESMPPGLHSVLMACFSRDLEQRPTTAELIDFPWFRQPAAGAATAGAAE